MFASHQAKQKLGEAQVMDLHAKIGQLIVEYDFFSQSVDLRLMKTRDSFEKWTRVFA